jgi:hypothetical protein
MTNRNIIVTVRFEKIPARYQNGIYLETYGLGGIPEQEHVMNKWWN